MDLSIDNYSY